MTRLGLLLALAALGALALAPAASQAAPKRATVGVFDDYFKPRPVTIRRGGKVVWRWRGRSAHNVVLYRSRSSRPVKRSRIQSSGRFAHRFRKRGKWRAVCELHSGMTMVVRVKRR